MGADELQRLLADALGQRTQAARNLEQHEKYYKQFLVTELPKRSGRQLDGRGRAQFEQALANYRQGHENCRHAVRELDWLVEQLEAQQAP